MIQVGAYRGGYTYNNSRVKEIIGHSKTYFRIKVEEIRGEYFIGTVQDDVDTGGMDDEGKIHGQFNENTVWFVKEMPSCVLIGANGKKIKLKSKHPLIYYKGSINQSKTEFSGTWRTQFTIKFLGLLPLPLFPQYGKFEMWLEKD